MGAIATLVAGAAAAALVIGFGWFDVAASSAHLRPVGWLIHRVMIQSVASRAAQSERESYNLSQAAAGYCLYRQHCQECHGSPAVAPEAWTRGLNPPPPYLVDARSRWSGSEIHWIIANGVKMTSMPAWKASLSAEQIHALTAFIETMPSVPPQAYAQWSRSPACPDPAQFGSALKARFAPPSPPPGQLMGPTAPAP